MTTDLTTTCPVCSAEPGHQCRALDYVTLPTVHAERTLVDPTPIFDALTREAS